MKKFNKVLALMLVLIMVLSLSACGSSSSSTSGGSNTDDTKTETPADDGSGDDASSDDASGGSGSTDPFYVYSFNTELGERLELIKEFIPDYDRIVYVNTGGNDTYQEKMDTLLAAPDAEDYPDIMLLEADYIKKYVSSDMTIPVEDLGITADDYKNNYEYTIIAATDERTGKVKGLSWQACPGAFMYRRSLAEKYLGTQEPDEVQEYVKDWDAFLETARTIKEKSGGECKILSSPGDLARVYQSDRSQGWVVGGKLTIDPAMDDYMEFNKILKEEDLTNNTAQWTEAWNAGASQDDTFAYFGCTWFLHWTIKANCGGEKPGEGTYGDWAMCKGPVEYFWGGSWISATAACADKDFAKEIMLALCTNTDAMYKIADESLDYVNNKEAVQKLIDDGKGPYEFLGGQDFLAVFEPLAEKVDLSTMTAYDQKINSAWDNEITAYAEGTKDKETAIADFKKAVTDMFPDVTAD